MRISNYYKYNLDFPAIYGIKCLVNNKLYIGGTKNLKGRMKGHKGSFKFNRNNKLLQSDWNKYGDENFRIIIFEKCKEDELNIKEKEYIYKLSPEYNITQSNLKSFIHAESTKEKIGDARIGSRHTKETKEEMSKNRIGKKNSFYGKKHTEDTKNKIRKLNKKDCDEILKMFKSGIKTKVIASKFNISSPTALKVKKGIYFNTNKGGSEENG